MKNIFTLTFITLLLFSAFGLNRSAQKIPGWEKLPVADWGKLVERWLQTITMTDGQ